MFDELDFSFENLDSVRNIIHDTCGIYLEDNKFSFLESKVKQQMMLTEVSSFNDYLALIDNFKSRALKALVTSISNKETYFFREISQFNALRDQVLPEIKNKKSTKNDKRLRILSTGCATGEEVYSIAIIVCESGYFFWDWDVEVTGIDVDGEALKTARAGVYYRNSFRSFDAEFLNKYLIRDNESYVMREFVKKMVNFQEKNLVEALSWIDMNDYDVIFCRNVLIYFSNKMARKATENIKQALRKDGYLFLGHSESIQNEISGFTMKKFPETVLYKKIT